MCYLTETGHCERRCASFVEKRKKGNDRSRDLDLVNEDAEEEAQGRNPVQGRDAKVKSMITRLLELQIVRSAVK